MTVLTKTYDFPRPITTAEIERLRDEYNDYWNAGTDRSVVFAGGDDPVALGLSKSRTVKGKFIEGDSYSILHYDAKGDFYFWTHDNVYGEETDGDVYVGYDGDDVEDHGHHECQNFA